MKTKQILTHITIVGILFAAVSCSEPLVAPTDNTDELKSSSEVITESDALSEEQIDDLLFVFEEEKMARDVYMFLFNKWGSTVFDNIIDSEQKHKDAIEQLLITYKIEYTDPDIPGEFTIPELQTLYNALTSSGEGSLTAALEVGMTIEDYDIEDLMLDLEKFENADIQDVLTNLINGSKNHLRAFLSSLVAQDADYNYTPQFISEDLYNEIISASTGQNGK